MTQLRRWKNFFRFYVAVPDFLLFLLGLALFWRPVAQVIFPALTWVSHYVAFPLWVNELIVSVLSNLVAAAVIAAVVIGALRHSQIEAMTGHFKAFDLTGGRKDSWGKVTIVRQLGGINRTGPRLRVRIERDDVVLLGEGIVVQEQHFIGFYRDVAHLARRRAGSFFMTLQGDGKNYEGQYVYFDPTTGTPSVGNARWESQD